MTQEARKYPSPPLGAPALINISYRGCAFPHTKINICAPDIQVPYAIQCLGWRSVEY